MKNILKKIAAKIVYFYEMALYLHRFLRKAVKLKQNA